MCVRVPNRARALENVCIFKVFTRFHNKTHTLVFTVYGFRCVCLLLFFTCIGYINESATLISYACECVCVCVKHGKTNERAGAGKRQKKRAHKLYPTRSPLRMYLPVCVSECDGVARA